MYNIKFLKTSFAIGLMAISLTPIVSNAAFGQTLCTCTLTGQEEESKPWSFVCCGYLGSHKNCHRYCEEQKYVDGYSTVSGASSGCHSRYSC